MESGFETIFTEQALHGALENLQTVISESHCSITFGKLPVVRGNHAQLVQLFQNLIGNALKFNTSPTPTIHIEAEPQQKDWLFTVKDNGIGFDSKYAKTIFTLFKRIHSKDEYPGTGIGLATCQKIVERHGGRIWADSQVGVGSCFYFTLKAAESS